MPMDSINSALDAAAAAFSASGKLPEVADWSSAQRVRFLNRLPRKLSKGRLDALQSAFDLNAATNMEIRFAWLDLAVANRYDPAVSSLQNFLTSQGRGKFVKPLITALANDASWGRPLAKRIYSEARPLYHPLVTRELDKLKL